jgi:hypothetical protein
MFTIKSEVIGYLYSVMILFKVLSKKFVKNKASQSQSFRVNFHKFHTLFSVRLSQLG